MGLASLGSPGQPQRSRSSGYLDPVKWRQEHCKKTHKKFAKEEPRGVHNTNVLRDGVTILRTIDPRKTGPSAMWTRESKRGTWVGVQWVEEQKEKDNLNMTVVLGGTSHVRVMSPLPHQKHRGRTARR